MATFPRRRSLVPREQYLDHDTKHDRDLLWPPGTVELLSRDKGSKVTLVPQPSNDPDDPLIWPIWRKCINYGLLAAMTISIFTGIIIDHIGRS